MSADLEPDAVMRGLTVHLVGALNRLLPDNLSLVETGTHVALLVGTRPPRTVCTHSVTVPDRLTDADVELWAGYLLSDIQDLVAMYVYTPWPITAGGRTTYAAASADGDRIRLSFASKDSTERIDLPDFVVPQPGRPVIAG